MSYPLSAARSTLYPIIMQPDTLLALEQLIKQGIHNALAAVVEASAETCFEKSFDKRRKAAQTPSSFFVFARRRRVLRGRE